MPEYPNYPDHPVYDAILRLREYPVTPTAKAIGIGPRMWEIIGAGQQEPARLLAQRLLALDAALPVPMPAGSEAQAAALEEAGEEIGPPPWPHRRKRKVKSEARGAVRLSAATELMSLIPDLGIEVFRTPDRKEWCRLPGSGEHEAYPLSGERVRCYLSAAFYEQKGRVVNAAAVKSALSILSHRAADRHGEWPAVPAQTAGTPGAARPQNTTGKVARPSAATELMDLIPDLGIEVFCTSTGAVWCQVLINGHHETHPLEGERMACYLSGAFYEHYRRVMPAGALPAALPLLKHGALTSGKVREVCVRIGGSMEAGKVYIDLANEAWEAIEIDAAGWRVVSNPPVPFYRPAGMLPLPQPVAGGSLEALRSLLNYGTEENFKLIVAFLVGALRPSGPYPVLSLQGGEGSGKSSLARLLIALIDPQKAALRDLPGRDPSFNLFVAAKNAWLQAYDNLSCLPVSLSDDFCRLATGGGKVKRTLYTNDDECRYEACRPVILTSIANVIYQPDLRERAMVLSLEKPPHVMEEARLNAQFERDRAGILGALFTAVSTALRQREGVCLAELPRLADFARWIEAASPALGWQPGEFCALLKGIQEEVKLEAIAQDPFAQELQSLLGRNGGTWRGSSRALLEEVNGAADETTRRGKGWPQTPADVSKRLTRMKNELRLQGVSIAKGERTNQGVTYSISFEENARGQVAAGKPEATVGEPAAGECEPGEGGCDSGASSPPEPQHRCGKCAKWLPESLLTRFQFCDRSVTWACAECRDETRAWVLAKDRDALEESP